jgi:hypothetical protein
MNMPGFHAEASLVRARRLYRRQVSGSVSSGGTGQIMPQLGISSDPDLGAYWRCIFNGGPELVCRFFGGLPPFTIGGFLLNPRTRL